MKKPSRTPSRQRGIAAITAILTVAIATMIAADMLWRSHLDQRRTQSALAAEQSWLYLRGAEVIAATGLADVARSDSHHLGQFWAQPIVGLPVDGGTVSGWVEDMQGRFNLNNLILPNGETDPLALEWFERLLLLLDLDPRLAAAVADWIDADTQEQFPVGAEDNAYTSRNPPYRPPNLPMTSASELLFVDGFDVEVYERLAPFVAALPVGTRLNVNTAPAELLASLDEAITLQHAQALIAQRGPANFSDYGSTFEVLLSAEMMQRIGQRSEYFRLSAHIQVGDHEWVLYSLLRSEENDAIRPILRSMGTD